MGQSSALLVLRAHSGVHAGVGQEVGTVDLPIQRERVTNFPVLRGPSLKGALRQDAQERGMSPADVALVFGPETTNAAEHAGALCVGDARLVLFPMRSLKGTFAWVTCPFALARLKRDLEDSGLSRLYPLGAIPQLLDKSWGLVCEKSQVLHKTQAGNKIHQLVVLESYGVDVTESQELTTLATQLGKLGLDGEEIKRRLVVVEDDLFQSLVTYGTEVVTRVHLDDETKTVKKGQLWTEELLPAESVLVSLAVCADARAKGRPATSQDLLGKTCQTIKGRFQIGGNETVGYGVCHAHWVGPIEMQATQSEVAAPAPSPAPSAAPAAKPAQQKQSGKSGKGGK